VSWSHLPSGCSQRVRPRLFQHPTGDGINRAGRWSAAADLARRYLASALLGTRDEGCRVRVMLAYSEARLAHLDTARAVLASADSICEGTAGKVEMATDLTRLHEELAGAPVSLASPSLERPWATADPRALVSMSPRFNVT